MKNPFAPFSPLHVVGSVLVSAGSAIVYSTAFRGSPRWTFAAIATSTLGALALVYAPSLFEAPPAPPPTEEQTTRARWAREIAGAVEAGDWQHAGELVTAAAQAHTNQHAAN
jgi:hypothetical protein